MNILVTSGHSRSKYTIALLNELTKLDHSCTCAEVKTFQISRLKQYFRQYGLVNLINKFSAHFLNNKKSLIYNETKPIKNFLNQRGIQDKTVSAYCKRNKITHIKTKSLNDSDFINKLEESNFDLVVYSGGGILRKDIIDIPIHGVLNAHSGFLPKFRGMNVIEWALIMGYLPQTTIHFIDKGIDTGNIIYSEPIPYSKDLYTYRGNATVHNIELLTKVISDFSSYKKNSITQEVKEGKQYFIMTDLLKNEVINILKNSSQDSFKKNH